MPVPFDQLSIPGLRGKLVRPEGVVSVAAIQQPPHSPAPHVQAIMERHPGRTLPNGLVKAFEVPKTVRIEATHTLAGLSVKEALCRWRPTSASLAPASWSPTT